MQSPQFLTYDEAREHLKQVDERRAKLRAECPPHLADVHAHDVGTILDRRGIAPHGLSNW